MADEDDQSQQEGAGPLRKKLSEVSNLATDALARAVIAEENLTHVTVEDFRGTDPMAVEEKARSLNAERQQAEEQALRRALESRGVTDIDKALAQLGGGGTNVDAAALARARGVGAITGTHDTGAIDVAKLPDQDTSAIKAYFAAQEKG